MLGLTALTFPINRKGKLITLALWAACMVSATSLGEPLGDPRELIRPHADPWHSALGHLEVPVTRVEDGYPKHYIEHCTAVAVTPGPNPLVLSAWHCLDGYQSLLKPIQLRMSGLSSPTPVQLLATGGSMEQDWAVLQPTAPIAGTSWIPLSTQPLSHDIAVLAAGFTEYTTPLDENPIPRSLVTHRACRITNSNQIPVASDCVAKQGASGGAILRRTQTGSLRLIGIISAGDGESVSLFYPSLPLLPQLSRLR
jgi:hypothetical protein